MHEPRNTSLQSRFADVLERKADQPALTWLDDNGRFTWRTYSEVFRDAALYAGRLRDAGLKPGGVCILALPSNETASLVLLGAFVLGARPLLVAPPVIQGANSGLVELLENLIRRTSADLVVIHQSMVSDLDRLRAVRRRTTFLVADTDFADLSGITPAEIATPANEDIAALQLTSGTTSRPKICVWRHRGVLAALDGMGEAMGLAPDDIFLNWTPLYHDMGLVNNFLLCFVTGTPLAMMSPTDFIRKPSLWLRALADTKATTTWSPNFGFAVAAQRIRDRDLEGVSLAHVKAFWNAAERIHYETLIEFEQRFAPFGLRDDALKTNFGCAENVGGATFSAPDGRFIAEHIDVGAMQERLEAVVVAQDASEPAMWVVSAGKPYPGLEVAILSAKGEPLPDGRIGQFGLKSPSRLEEYLGNAKATAHATKGEYLLTGDMGYLRDGEVFWTGRTKERIKVRGRQFDPSDFEGALIDVPDLRKGCFAVFGVDDTANGTQRIVVLSELIEEPTLSHEEIVASVRRSISNRIGVMPSEVALVGKGTLQKTTSGKRRNLHLRQDFIADRLPVLFRQ